MFQILQWHWSYLVLSTAHCIWSNDLFVPRKWIPQHSMPLWFSQELQHHLSCICSLKWCYKLRLIHTGSKKIVLQAKLHAEIEDNHFCKGPPGKLYSYIRSVQKSNNLPPVMSYRSCSAQTRPWLSITFSPLFILQRTWTAQCHISGLLQVYSKDWYLFLRCLQHTHLPGSIQGNGLWQHWTSYFKVAFYPAFWTCSWSFYSLFVNCWHTYSMMNSMDKPKFKSEDRYQVSNYRPISLLCSSSKVLDILFMT